MTTKDGVRIILKPVAVGEQRLQTRLRAELRHKIVSILTEEAQLRTAPEFVREMLAGRALEGPRSRPKDPLPAQEDRNPPIRSARHDLGRGPGARSPAPRGRRGANPAGAGHRGEDGGTA